MNILFTINGCHKCEKAREHLSNINIEYKEVNILGNRDAVQKLKQLIGEVYTPVFVSGDIVLKDREILKYRK